MHKKEQSIGCCGPPEADFPSLTVDDYLHSGRATESQKPSLDVLYTVYKLLIYTTEQRER